MQTRYPNLELLEYMFIQRLVDIYGEFRRQYRYDITADVFSQTWESTALGFDGVGGAAMTTAYTTVFTMNFRKWKDAGTLDGLTVCGVFFGNELAYVVMNPEDLFWDDMNHRVLLKQRDAVAEYGAEIC